MRQHNRDNRGTTIAIVMTIILIFACYITP